jgi:phage terminase large subunit GpA-like protein
MLGRWVKTNPASPIAGFHISALYSSFKTIPELVYEFLSSKDDPEQLKVFVNTRLAETWKSDATSVGEINWMMRVEDYTQDSIPEGVLFVTAGIDVQVDRLEMEVVGWGILDESWSLEYIVIQGDPTSPTPWMQLDNILGNVYTRTDGLKMKINATCIDSGHCTQDVINFARKNAQRNVFPIKGRQGPLPIMSKKSKHYAKGGRFYTVGTDTAKERVYSHLRVEKPGPGYSHFPSRYGDDYFQGLTSEKYIIKYKRGHPFKQWFKKPSVRNEPLDTRVYAMAARQTITMNLEKRAEQLKESVKKATETVLEQTPVEKIEEAPSVVAAQIAKNVGTPQTNNRPRRPPRGSGWMSGMGRKF